MNGKVKHVIGPLEIVQVRSCFLVLSLSGLSCRQRRRRIRRINLFHHFGFASHGHAR